MTRLAIRPEAFRLLGLDDQVDGGEVLVVAPRLAGLDADQVDAGGVDLDGVPLAGLAAGLEVHVEGGLEHHVAPEVGQFLLTGLLFARR